MATTIENIRFKVETNVKDTIDNESVIEWCNDAQSEIIMMIDIPAQTTLAITTTDLSYTLPVTDIKRINRLWLQSERDKGADRDISVSYRLYNSKIIFGNLFSAADTLNIEYYKHMKYFTLVADLIDLNDRYTPLYTSYGQAQYYDLPHVIERLGEQQARRQYEKHYGRYMNIRDQISAYYASQAQPSTIKEWV